MTEQALRGWLTDWLARRLDIPEQAIDPDEPLANLGLSSLAAVELSGALEDLLDRSLPPTMAYEVPTVASLARFLTTEPAPGQGPAAPSVGPESGSEPVAVIGLGCRLPGGAATPEAYWRLLSEGRDAIAPAPPERLDLYRGQFPESASVLAATGTKGGYLSEDLAAFDADFFGLSAREASAADPQQRLMLEVAWEALEHAGVPPRSLAGTRTGVFVGASVSDYGTLQMSDLDRIDAWSGIGSALSVIANRISYTLGLRGPSLVVDTACSSSLVAVHQAVQSLRTGETDLALAGGVNLLLSPAVTVNFEEAGVMAADGRCKTFAADADGYGRGEGCGVVVLKRLSAARRDGDRVLAVIRGSAVNQDGASNGLMAPNPQAQEELLRTAGAVSALRPEDIDYIEAHGTGTALGDPIEVRAVTAALLEEAGPRAADLLIGSAKTNIGHLEAAAGIAGLIKVVLSLVHEELPPSLNFDRPNPLIPFDDIPLRVVTAATPWPRGERIRRAGVSGFGFSGTNAHVVLEEAPAAGTPRRRAGDEAAPCLVPLSAGSPTALREQAQRLADWLAADDGATPFQDLVHTLALRRSHETHRACVVGADHSTLRGALRALAGGTASPDVVQGRARHSGGPVWVFSGQGSQWAGMGRELLRSEPAFRTVVDELEPLMLAEGAFSLREMLAAEQLPTDVSVVQPLLFAMQLGLGAMWREHGVRPAAVIGHSMGEVAAAVVSGALSTEDGVRVICRRSRLLAKVAGEGAMAVIERPAEVLAARLATVAPGGEVEVAVVPSPGSTVISGDADIVRKLTRAYEDEGVNARLVQVDVASHSPRMDPLLEPLLELLDDLSPAEPEIEFFSTVGDRVGDTPVCDAAYWADNLRAPVRLADAVRAAAMAGHSAFVEISPHPVLVRDVRATLRDSGVRDALVGPTLVRDLAPYTTFLAAVGRLHCHGLPLPWEELTPAGELADLPRQSWLRRRYWSTAARPAATAAASLPVGPVATPGRGVLGHGAELAALPGTRLWQTDLSAPHLAALHQHRVGGQALLPVSAYLRLALAAAAEAGAGHHVVRDLTVHAAVVLDGDPVALQILLRPSASGSATAELDFHSRAADGEWTHCASARLHEDPAEIPAPRPVPVPVDGSAGEPVEADAYYGGLEQAGLAYGPALRVIRRLRELGDGVLAEPALPRTDDGGAGGVTPPDDLHLVLDAAFQALPACLWRQEGPHDGMYTVVGIDSLSFRAPTDPVAGPLRVAARVAEEGDRLVAALDWYQDGVLRGRARGVRLRRIGGRPDHAPASWLRSLEWTERPSTGEPADGAVRHGKVLLVGVDDALAAAVGRRLEAHGMACRTVSADDLDGVAPTALAARLGGLDDVRHLVHGPGAGPADGLDPDTAAQALRIAGRATRLIQAVAAATDTEARLWFVTSGAQAVRDEPTLHPAQAVLWGLGRSAALEHPERWGGLVDLDHTADTESSARVLVADLLSERYGEQSAHRAGARYVPRLTDAVRPVSAPAVLDDQGSHLVVGATGRLGPALLDRLVRLGARHLVLMSRRGLTGAATGVVDRLRAQGVTITPIAADVTDETDVRELFTRFGTDLPPLRGIYQAAFVEDVSTLADMSEERLAAVLHPKITGTALLHRCSAGHDVEQFLCYSSTTALLGSQGLAHYAAAGCFLDTLVHARRLAGLPAQVINWGPWDDGLDDPAARAAILASGLRLMPGERAVAAVDQMLAGSEAQVVVADADWPAVAAAYATRTPLPLLDHLTAPAPAAPAPPDGRTPADGDLRGLLATAPEGQRLTLVQRHVQDLVARALSLPGADALAPDADFFALGMDSLTTMTVLRRLKALVPGLRPQIVYENRTAAALAGILLELLEQRPDGAARN
ncbi:SDR family NAD(P)-dependent oxidoreductase [Streptomyces sp. NBC_01353]|uniref:SDR family NAD(P)-dependent oxidoreductase n=1 Tax=Streptomyces sp. NBC_01353 TaxID=2903835 RepID=UPI002E33F527|nr:SDR family NAD(P)-dependent oxidoreductase [Streptomyces sp. NBC_01353]